MHFPFFFGAFFSFFLLFLPPITSCADLTSQFGGILIWKLSGGQIWLFFLLPSQFFAASEDSVPSEPT